MIGQKDIELDFLKKVVNPSLRMRVMLIEKENEDLSLVKQCELLGINRSRLHYQPNTLSEETRQTMNLIDKYIRSIPFTEIEG
jgi:putative transposase